MNAGLLVQTLLAATLCGACSMPLRPDLLGDPAPLTAATRTILIASDTAYVNVTGGEVVKFVVGDKSFAWNFDAEQYLGHFDLSQVAPPGVLDHSVSAYVSPNPLYSGAGGGGRRGGERGNDFSSGGHGGGGGGHK